MPGGNKNRQKSTPESQKIDKNHRVEGKRAKIEAKSAKNTAKRGHEDEKRRTKRRGGKISPSSAAVWRPVGGSRRRNIENIEADCKILHAYASQRDAADLQASPIAADP